MNQIENLIQSSPKICHHCKTTITRMWRNIPNGEVVCNSCGLYYIAEKSLPKRSIDIQQFTLPSIEDLRLPKPKCSGPTRCNGTGGNEACRGCPTLNQGNYHSNGIHCSNCGTSSTPLWRRSPDGSPLCNACGLYFKLHSNHRPSNMKSPTIKRRKRLPALPDLPKITTPKLETFDSRVVGQHIATFGNSLVISSQVLSPTSLRDMLNSVSSFQAFLSDALSKLESVDLPKNEASVLVQQLTPKLDE